MTRLPELLWRVLELARAMWSALDAHGFFVAGDVAISRVEQIPARVRRDYMLAPIYASGVSLEAPVRVVGPFGA